MKKIVSFIYAFLLFSAVTFAQNSLKLKVADAGTKLALPVAKVKINEQPAQPVDSTGSIIIALGTGTNTIEISAFNYEPQTLSMETTDTAWHTIYLNAQTGELEEVIFVASTRNNQSIENSPLKVEVLGKEEVSEEVGIKPGNIASILGDVSGVQIQQSSAVSGNSNVRIQGLSGRYTQILRDGMPLYDGFSGGFGILTIPPLDLRQIELIKGSASTLYGGGAIAGLVNLISKKPTTVNEGEILINYTTLDEFDLNGYLAKRGKRWGYTLFAGNVQQSKKDINKDTLTDVAASRSILIHPKLFYYPSDKTIISVGYSFTTDRRVGGNINIPLNINIANLAGPFYEKNTSKRQTGEYAIEHFYNDNTKLVIKGLLSGYANELLTNTYYYKAQQISHYNEATLNKAFGKADFVGGINFSGDNFNPTKPLMPIQTFTNFTFGAFSQLTWHFKENTLLEGGLRVDKHNNYGVFALPRIAFFHRSNEHFATRLGFGMGYKTPNPFSQQDIDYNILMIKALSNQLKAEQSYGYNAEGNYKKSWGKNSLFINHAFFLTQVDNPILFNPDLQGRINLANAPKPILTMGFDTYLKLTIDKWELYGGYTYTDARRSYLSTSTFVPLTSRNRMAFVLVREIEEKWRFGLEGSYFGSQYRYDATKTPGYFFVAAMALRNFGKHFTVVVNCENLFDYRMSKVESLYIGTLNNPTFKPLWAPIDGRVVNVSLRLRL